MWLTLLAAPAWAQWTAHLDDLRAVVATELLVPRAVWFNELGPMGFETRSWQLRVVLSCQPAAGKAKRNRVGVRCEVQDAALQASAFLRTPDDDPEDTRRVLQEMVQHLEGATISLVVTPEGRQISWAVEGLPDGSPRETQIGRLLAVHLERATAGLILERPSDALRASGQWAERTSPLLRFPELDVSQPPGVSEQVHRVAPDTTPVRVDGGGVAMLIDPPSGLTMKTEARSVAELGDDGRLLTRSWTVDGASDGVVVYHHAGWMRRLGPDDVVDLGPTRQVRAPGEAAQADPLGLPEWPTL